MMVIAEGIEKPEELIVLRDMEVHVGQGFLLGRPSADPRTHVTLPTQASPSSRPRAERG